METKRTRDWRNAQKRRNKSRDIRKTLLNFRGEKKLEDALYAVG